MKNSKRKKLERAGWRVAGVQELLDLTEAEVALIEMKCTLMQLVRDTRNDKNITQIALAELMQSSQSRVAKLEAESSDVSLDLIVRALFALGVTNRQLAEALLESPN